MEETTKNLAKAFVAESQAQIRYVIYAKNAKKEGLEHICEIFLATANNEREHAELIFRLINELKEKEGENFYTVNTEVSVPVSCSSTLQNLRSSIEEENYEYTQMYVDFANTAELEGLEEIAKHLQSIAVAEHHHSERYKKFLEELENNAVFQKEEDVYWVCQKCGYVFEGKESPEKCSLCGCSKKHFEYKDDDYLKSVTYDMTKEKQIYKCSVCENEIEILRSGAGRLICCESPMKLVKKEKSPKDNAQNNYQE